MRTRWVAVALVILAAMAVADSVRAQAPRRTLTIGMPVTPPNLPHLGVYVAKELGYFEEEGINLDLASFESGLQSLRGGVAGSVDLLGASAEPVISAISRGAKIRSVFSYAHKLTVVMVAQKSIQKSAELRGKNLGIQEVGAFREVMTRAVLQTAGLTAQDVNYIPVSSAGYITALLGNKIDTAILHIDQAYMARTKEASLHVLVPLWEIMPSYWYGTFSTTEDLLRKEPDLLARAVGAIIKAHRFMTQDFYERGLIINENSEEYDGTTAVVRTDHLAAEAVEFLRWRAERWMKLRHLPAVLFHSPWFTLRNGPKMLGHIFRGATIKSLLGLENEKKAFERYRAIRKAERAYA